MNKRERRTKKARAGAGGRNFIVRRVTVPPREGPRPTLQEFLDEWIEKGREIFTKEQKIDPTYIGWLPDNSQIILTMPRFGDKREQQGFNIGSEDMLREKGAVMILRVGEAWTSVNLSLRPIKAEDRREVVIFKAGDNENDLLAVLEIHRDWQDGKATLGEPENAKDTGQ